MDSVFVVSVIHGLPRPKKIWKIKEINSSLVSKHTKQEQAITWCNPAAKKRPVFDSFSFVPVLTLACKLATILLLVFSLFELVAALLQCMCSESNKKSGEVGE
jgi:hypothetical protein